MKYPNEMCLFKVTLIRDYKDNILDFLSKLSNVHIKSISKKSIFKFSKESKEDYVLEEKIKKLRENINELFKKFKISEYDFRELKFNDDDRLKFVGKNLRELLNRTFVEIDFYINRINELERYITKATIELENINMIKKCYSFLNEYNLNRISLTKFNQLSIKVYTTFSKNLSNLTTLFEFSSFPNIYQTKKISTDRIILCTIYPKDRNKDLKERVNIIHAEEVPILNKYLTYDSINFKRINKEINFIEKTISKYKKELQQIRNDNLLKFAALNEVVQNLEKYRWASSQFEELSSTHLLISFFVPLKIKKEADQKLTKNLKDNIKVDIIDINRKPTKKKSKNSELEKEKDEKYDEKKNLNEEDDLIKETPTIMRNAFFIRPFETITKLYGTPSYSEIDPTPFIAFTFPFLFGLMFGDIGHGICLIIAGLLGAIIFGKKKGVDLYNICWIIFYCGWGAVLFGFLYGEFFGMHNICGIPLEPITIGNITLYNPLDNIITLFKIAILIGVFHINLGWFVQFLNYWKHSRKYLAFTDSLCKILLLTGGAILIFIFWLNIADWFAPPYPILLIVLPGLFLIISKPLGRLFHISYLKEDSYGELLGEGSIETFETFLSILSNVASYARLLALCLAHIALMIVIQAMVGLIQGEGIFIQVLIVIGLILGNLIVIVFEGLLVFINNLRLHFYEFFSKFYQGSGIEFLPFELDNNYSIIEFEITTERDVISEEIDREISIKDAKENIERAVNYISTKYY